MYVRIVEFTLGPGTRETAERLADQVNRLCPSLQGFHSVSFFGDFDTGQYGAFYVWRTRADADAAANSIVPLLQREAGTLLKAPPTRRTFELYLPKG